MSPAYRRADELRIHLAACYRDEAEALTRAAERLEASSVDSLSRAAKPVPYVCRRWRAVEDALDSALVAL